MSPYTYSQIYSSAEYLSDGLPLSAMIRPLLCTRFTHRSGLTDRSQPIRSSTCFADPDDVELVTQCLLIADADLDEISRVKFEFAVSFDMKDHSGSLKAY